MQLVGCWLFSPFVIAHTIGCRINTSLTSRTGGRKCERGVAGQADNQQQQKQKYITLNGGNFHSTIVRNTNKNNNNTVYICKVGDIKKKIIKKVEKRGKTEWETSGDLRHPKITSLIKLSGLFLLP